MITAMGSVCITYMAGKPPIKTSITISLSGSNGHADQLAEEETVDEPHEILVRHEVPSSVEADIRGTRASSGGIEQRSTLTSDDGHDGLSDTGQRSDKGLGHPTPPRLLGHNEEIGVKSDDGDLVIVYLHLVSAQAKVWHRRPTPSKTERQYWFSISRLKLPAAVGRHGAVDLISKGETNGDQVVVITQIMAIGHWRKSNLFSQTVTLATKDTGRLATTAKRDQITNNGDINNKTIRPAKGASVSGR